MATKVENLENCYICTHHQFEHYPKVVSLNGKHRIACSNCTCSTNWYSTIQEACNAWNSIMKVKK